MIRVVCTLGLEVEQHVCCSWVYGRIGNGGVMDVNQLLMCGLS